MATAYAAAEAPRPRRRFTILLPILRPPTMLPHAVRSVQAQSVADFELCIISDGAPPETVACAEAMQREDPRIRVFAFAKGERHGEAHRAAVLRGSTSEFIAQIGDDDLWLPDHLAQLAHRLSHADFVSLCQVRMHEDDRLSVQPFADLDDIRTRDRMLGQVWNFFGPTEAGYRLSAYRSLPVGWTPAPHGLHTDLFMWRKFLAMPGLRFRSDLAVTSVKFGAADWKEWPLDRRAEIMASHAMRLAHPAARATLRRRATMQVADEMGLREVLRLSRRSPAIASVLASARVQSRLAQLFRPQRT